MKPLVVIGVLVVGAAGASAKVKKPLVPAHAPIAAAAPTPFDPEEAAQQIRARMGGVRACYMRASRFDPSLRGKLQLGFDIADSGQVASTQVEVDGLHVDDDAIAASLTRCIQTQALGWRLSPEGPAGGAHVSYVFVFAAAH